MVSHRWLICISCALVQIVVLFFVVESCVLDVEFFLVVSYVIVVYVLHILFLNYISSVGIFSYLSSCISFLNYVFLVVEFFLVFSFCAHVVDDLKYDCVINVVSYLMLASVLSWVAIVWIWQLWLLVCYHTTGRILLDKKFIIRG
jgi:hypothetical protein